MAERRLFVGLDLGRLARAVLAEVVDGIGPLPGRPTPPRNWHVTLRFVGDAGDVATDRLLAALDEEIDLDPLDVSIVGMGAFPRARRATVLWAGIHAAGLEELAAQVEEACQAAGFPPEDRPFHPHLSLSRIRPPADVTALLATPLGPIRDLVEEVTVFESLLGGPEGTRYRPIETFPL